MWHFLIFNSNKFFSLHWIFQSIKKTKFKFIIYLFFVLIKVTLGQMSLNGANYKDWRHWVKECPFRIRFMIIIFSLISLQIIEYSFDTSLTRRNVRNNVARLKIKIVASLNDNETIFHLFSLQNFSHNNCNISV